MIRFVLDENLPLRAAELLAAFGFPFTSTIEIADLGRGASDEAIARWCGKNRVVWVTLDRGVLKDEAIVAAIAQAPDEPHPPVSEGDDRARLPASLGLSVRPDRAPIRGGGSA